MSIKNYQSFEFKKRGIFEICTGIYELPIGWIQKHEEREIIGETDLLYVTHLLKSSHGEWVGNKVIQHQYVLPIGIHKSRLVEWVNSQLSIFD
jgi:hypothetical protein